MSKLTKFTLALLIISSIASVLFLTGIINVSALPGLYVVFPLAAICYGLFLIFHAMDKEVAAFDADEHTHHDHAVPEGHPRNVEFLHDPDQHDSIAA